MAKAARSKKSEGPPDPDKLVRQEAGTYRTGDDRFEVRGGDGSWFLVDTAGTNEFGQALIQGPFASLKAVRSAIPDARASEPVAAKPRAKPSAKPAKAPRKQRPDPPPPPPRSWLDDLPAAEAARTRELIAELERAGVGDAEPLVRRDREGLFPAVATRLVELRLDALTADMPEGTREAARTLIRKVAETLTEEGRYHGGPLPGWSLVEVGPEPEPPNRRIDLRP